jgi:biopolymer transport protein TolQ
VQRTGPVNQTVLALLAILSIVSWAIIIHKSWAYRSAGRHTRTFLDVFRKSSKFSEVQAVCTTIPDSPLVGVFQAGYAEINAQLRLTAPAARAIQRRRPRVQS